jgi:ligand-binding sensor domain-containing protein
LLWLCAVPVHAIDRALSLAQLQRLCVGTTTGLARLDDRRWTIPTEATTYPHGPTFALHADHAGTLWAVAEDGTWFLPRGAAAFQRSSRSGSSRP